jgi:hypothetical protein
MSDLRAIAGRILANERAAFFSTNRVGRFTATLYDFSYSRAFLAHFLPNGIHNLGELRESQLAFS